jgi:hypothetical protein
VAFPQAFRAFVQPLAKKEIAMSEANFPIGSVVITANAKNVLNDQDILQALVRHMAGDWGEVCEDDRCENELSLLHGFRLLSVYHDRDGTKFWIITEADRSATTILLPEDY